MKAKDTVMNPSESSITFARAGGTLEGLCQRQSEISFKAGVEGKRQAQSEPDKPFRISRFPNGHVEASLPTSKDSAFVVWSAPENIREKYKDN